MDARALIEDDEEPLGFDWSKLFKAKPTEMAMRFVFGAGIALIAGIAGARFGPKFGGLFLAFPAVLPATLTLVEKKEGHQGLVRRQRRCVLGAVGLAAFAFTALLLLGTNAQIALLLALLAWVLIAGGLYFLLRM